MKPSGHTARGHEFKSCHWIQDRYFSSTFIYCKISILWNSNHNEKMLVIAQINALVQVLQCFHKHYNILLECLKPLKHKLAKSLTNLAFSFYFSHEAIQWSPSWRSHHADHVGYIRNCSIHFPEAQGITDGS